MVTKVNNLQIPEKTMTSLEIAILVDSRHDSVKRTIERLYKSGVISQPPSVFGEKSPNGKTPFHYNINKRDSYVVVAQISPEFTGRLVDRWQELESKQVTPQLPQSFAEALQLAANQAKQLEEQAPKIEVYNMLAERTHDVNTTVLAKQIGISAIKLNKFLKVEGVKCQFKDYPAAKYADWFNVVPVVSGAHEGTQCLITPLGQTRIAALYTKRTAPKLKAVK